MFNLAFPETICLISLSETICLISSVNLLGIVSWIYTFIRKWRIACITQLVYVPLSVLPWRAPCVSLDLHYFTCEDLTLQIICNYMFKLNKKRISILNKNERIRSLILSSLSSFSVPGPGCHLKLSIYFMARNCVKINHSKDKL